MLAVIGLIIGTLGFSVGLIRWRLERHDIRVRIYAEAAFQDRDWLINIQVVNRSNRTVVFRRLDIQFKGKAYRRFDVSRCGLHIDPIFTDKYAPAFPYELRPSFSCVFSVTLSQLLTHFWAESAFEDLAQLSAESNRRLSRRPPLFIRALLFEQAYKKPHSTRWAPCAIFWPTDTSFTNHYRGGQIVIRSRAVDRWIRAVIVTPWE